MLIIEISFWLFVVTIIYVYFGYLLFLVILRKDWPNVKMENIALPSVSLIVAAYNEEKVIENKVENILSLDYPKDKLQVIVASDCSTDRTNEIVKRYFDKGVELYIQKKRKGKSTALNYVVGNLAKGEIIVFNDATTLLEKDSIKKIVSCFSESIIGAATGKLVFRGPKDSLITQNHQVYWRYEEFLREKESKAGYLPFVSGAFYAIRKNLYTSVPENLPDDSVSPLGVYKKGYTVVYVKDALAYETGPRDTHGEFKIKARGVLRELSSIFYFKELLNPFKYPILSFVLISHRLMRYSVSLFLIALFFANLSLLGNTLYKTFFFLQISFYLFAVCGLIIKKNIRIISIPFYFSLVNIAALWGIIRFMSGQKESTWKSVR